MISITISDPSTTGVEELRALIAFLSSYVPSSPQLDKLVDHTLTPLPGHFNKPIPLKPGSVLDKLIHPDDNPATGKPEETPLPTLCMPQAEVVIHNQVPSAAEAFKLPKDLQVPSPPSAVITPQMAPGGVLLTAVAAPSLTAHGVIPGTLIGQMADLSPLAHAAVQPTGTVVPPPPNLASVVDVDSRGLIWDGRIHASSKNKVGDGTWRARRGVEPATVAQVEAELRQVASIPVAVNAVTNVASNVPAPPNMGFAELLPKITGALTTNAVSQGAIFEALANVGLQTLPQLASRPDLVGRVNAILFP